MNFSHGLFSNKLLLDDTIKTNLYIGIESLHFRVDIY